MILSPRKSDEKSNSKKEKTFFYESNIIEDKQQSVITNTVNN